MRETRMLQMPHRRGLLRRIPVDNPSFAVHTLALIRGFQRITANLPPDTNREDGAAMNPKFSFARCFSKGWNAFMHNPTPAILGPIIVYAILTVLEGVAFPITGLLAVILLPLSLIAFGLFTLLVIPPFYGGIAILALNVVSGRNPSITDVFKGFKKYGQFLVAFFLWSVLVSLVAIPVIVGQTVGLTTLLDMTASSFAGDQTKWLAIIIIVALIGLGLGYISFLLGWVFVFFVIGDYWFNDSVGAAFSISSRMSGGNKIKLFFSLVVLSVFAALGLLIFGIGFFATSMISTLVLAAIYEELKTDATCSEARGWYEHHGADIAVG